MHQILLSQLNIYPVKSAGGIALQSGEVAAHGLRYDRRWMLVDNNDAFLTQRDFPRMALIKVQLTDGGLRVDAPEMDVLRIPEYPREARTISVVVWEDSVQALTVSAEADAWFSEYLNASCRLVYMPDSADRVMSVRSVSSKVSFADGYPLLMISEASLEDLNAKLSMPVPMNRFRPNLVVKGCPPFAEDTWKEIQIGSILFHVVKPCERCMITTVDQTTGVKGSEPLRALASYRQQDGKVLFGQNLIQGGSGVIHVGDTIDVIQFKIH